MRINSENVSFQKVWILRKNIAKDALYGAKEIKNAINQNDSIKNLDKKNIDVFILAQDKHYGSILSVAFADIKAPRRVYLVDGLDSIRFDFSKEIGKDKMETKIKRVIEYAQKIERGKCKTKTNCSSVLNIINLAFPPRRK